MSEPMLLGLKKKLGPITDIKSVRFVILRAGNNNQYPTIEEVEIRNSANVLVSRLSGNAGSASTVYSSGGINYSANGPFDGVQPGVQVNQWCPTLANVANTGRTCWWAITFSQQVDLASIDMFAQASINRYPVDMDIEVSHNGLTFEKLVELRNLSGWAQNVKKSLWKVS
jgi:hypothetical protein